MVRLHLSLILLIIRSPLSSVDLYPQFLIVYLVSVKLTF